ncbi:MAG: hypothetical protein AAGD32_16405 [Planctomycetota bacterium]
MTVGTRHFWRLSTEDGIYARGQFPLRGSAGDERFVGIIINGSITRKISPGITASLEGSYLDDNPPGEDTAFAVVDVKIRF